jgi:hypothetical protein
MKKSNSQFYLALFKLLTNLVIFKILPVTRFKGPKAAILTLKMLLGSRL